MSFAKRFGIAAAMEEINEQESNQETVPEVEGEVEIPVAEDTVETAVAEVETAESDVEQADVAIGEAEADVGALDTIADKISESEETGGLDASSAAVVEVAVEHLYQRLGVSKRAKGMVAIESFGADSSRKKATTISAENIKETAQKVWDGILAMIEKAKEFVMNFFKAVFTANGRLKERATKLKTAIEKLQGNPSKDSIENAGFASKVAINNEVKAEVVTAFLNGTNENANWAMEFVESAAKQARDLGEAVKKYETGEFKAEYFVFGTSFMKETDKYGAAEEGFKNYIVEDLQNIGGKTIVYHAYSKQAEGEEALKAMKGLDVSIKDAPEASEVTAAPVLSKEQMTGVLDAVIKSVDDSETLKKTIASIETTFKDIINDVKQARNKQYQEQAKQKQNVGEKAKDLNTIRKITNDVISAIRSEVNAMSKTPTAVLKLSLMVAQGATEWVGQSAKLYTGDLPTIDKEAGKEDKAAA